MADLSGTWLGTYWQEGVPTRFEATLLQSGNTLTGRILDDNYLGEASLTGEVVGRRISFVKRYLTGSHHSISYTGTVSESEDFMQGQWSISRVGSGSWEAHRGGENLMVELQTRLADRVPASVGASALSQ
ncbi:MULTISPECIES: hypothetical protein [unclassified Coleofasciculus]|uniref:hypothetical protein n=1 Tax=unclassified Coleofasciculus TaxID=2692782 RepID=UPI0018809076|nr:MULTISPECIES: hypothetical protein [unclassified Coleofasciculus]MBE9127104.1 hypothetical protein [Coleofasciculus sp. LEGE 07081]MBE9150427.1 hypothetical protein [Coleofasciculus sp. LEGE 07092]